MIPSRDGALSATLVFALAAVGLVAGLILGLRKGLPAAKAPAAAAAAEHSPASRPGPSSEAGEARVYQRTHDLVMGSGYHSTAVFAPADDVKARAALAGALQAALDCEKRISKYDPESEVRRVWAAGPGDPVQVSADTFRALELSVDLWKRSGGAFDCTVQPLIDLYKFTGREERMPTDAEIAAARAKVGSDKLLLDPEKRTVALAAPGMKFDLGAVGQGLGADVACEALRKAGATGALVEIGGEVRAFGHKPDGSPWRIEVVHPRALDRRMAVVELDGNAVSTSGDYEKYFLTKEGGRQREEGRRKKAEGRRQEAEGGGGAPSPLAPPPSTLHLQPSPGPRRASHIIDPRTGKPLVGGAVSVTIIAPDCALADGLATAVSVLGPVEGMKLVESYRAEGKAVEALIVEETAEGKLMPHLSPGLKDKLEVDLDVSVQYPAPAPAAAPAAGE